MFLHRRKQAKKNQHDHILKAAFSFVLTFLHKQVGNESKTREIYIQQETNDAQLKIQQS